MFCFTKKFFILILCSFLYIWQAQAAVVQSAGAALSNDTFVRNKSRHVRKAPKEINISTTRDGEEAQSSVPFQEQGKSSSFDEENVVKEQPKEDDENDDLTVEDKNFVPNYSKAYAEKLFKSYSGYITIEQENIPRRLNITKGSYLQFNLEEKPDTIWHFDLNEDIAQIILNKVEDGKRTLVILAVEPGNTRLFLDNISVKDNNFRSLFSKNMLIMVD